MGTLIKYRTGMDDEQVAALCDQLDELCREHEAIERKSMCRDWFDCAMPKETRQ